MATELRSPLGPVSRGPSFKNTHTCSAKWLLCLPCFHPVISSESFSFHMWNHVAAWLSSPLKCHCWSELKNSLEIISNESQSSIQVAENVKKSEGAGNTLWVHCISGHAKGQFNPRPPGDSSQRVLRPRWRAVIAPYMMWNSLQAAVSHLTCSITHGDQENAKNVI